MSANPNRLYELLPAVYRLRDVDQGYVLQALLQVIAEQVNIVEADIAQLYENWFIETCQDWVVPYIGDLIGYQTLNDTGEPGNSTTARTLLREEVLIPRRDVGQTLQFRRRKGTFALLGQLAGAVAGWPAHAVESYRLLSLAQSINHLRMNRGRTVNLRHGDALARLGGPFDEIARKLDVRRVDSHRSRGRYDITNVGVFVWRLKTYSVTKTPAYCLEEAGPNCYLFSVLGNDTPLFHNPSAALPSTYRANELAFPTRIRRRPFSERTGDYYGDAKDLQIYVGSSIQPVPLDQIVAADLSDWTYRPEPGKVAVDPHLGRIVFAQGAVRKQGVWATYHYGFSADIGGGEYDRPLSEHPKSKLYLVGEGEDFRRINDALKQWQTDKPQYAVIEITDSGAYVEPLNISLNENQTLQIRAANRKRPVIRLLDWQTSMSDNLSVTGAAGSRFVLDGLLITGRGIQIDGEIVSVNIRHSTIVPGWGLHCDCGPRRPIEPSIELLDAPECITIEHSIVGTIEVTRDETKVDPVQIRISDSVLDSTSPSRVALGPTDGMCAYASLWLQRSTVIGFIDVHSFELGENSILMGLVRVARRQQGCIRFCYVPHGSRTPRRYECQPDLLERPIIGKYKQGLLSVHDRDALLSGARLRVEPEFNSLRYGTPTYCQLAGACASEIRRGADDQSEMGVFHDLYQPQRAANLRARLNDFTPAGGDVGIIFAS
jgi:hypothetical protein